MPNSSLGVGVGVKTVGVGVISVGVGITSVGVGVTSSSGTAIASSGVGVGLSGVTVGSSSGSVVTTALPASSAFFSVGPSGSSESFVSSGVTFSLVFCFVSFLAGTGVAVEGFFSGT